MNIIILEDKKGFKKSIEVPVFPPDYRIAMLPKLKVISRDLEEIARPNIQSEIITFYPKGEPKTEYGVSILLYKEF